MYGNGGESPPLVPVVRLPAGTAGDRPGRARRAAAGRADSAEGGAGLARRRLRLHGRSRPSPPRTAAPRSSTSSRAAPTTRSAATSTRSATCATRSAASRSRGAPVLVTGYDALADSSGSARRRAGRAARGPDRRPRRADRARLRVRLAARPRAARDGDLLDPRLVPAALGPDRDHRRLADRAVPGRADRSRRLDRLRADHRRALARGAREGQGQRGGRRGRDGDRRTRGRLLRHHGRGRPAGAGGDPAAVPAQHGLRRAADPAGRDARRDHAAAGDPRDDRAAARPPPPAPERPQRSPSGSAGRQASCATAAWPRLTRARDPRSRC